MAKLEEKPRKFLDESPYVGVVTTLREDGSPHSTIVWVDVEGDKVSFNTARGRAKPKHLEHDPRASLLMVDPNDAFKWVAVSGPAELTEEGQTPRSTSSRRSTSARTNIRGGTRRKRGSRC